MYKRQSLYHVEADSTYLRRSSTVIAVSYTHLGWCYREKPDGQYPDSGWRFFSGEESDEYTNDVNNVGVYSLNTICNYDPDILPLLTAPYGTAYARGEDGKFYAEPFEVPNP